MRPTRTTSTGFAAAFPDLSIVRVSVLDESSLDDFRAAVWELTGLIRVRLRKDGSVDPEPVALDPGATVADVADWVHHDLGASVQRGPGVGPVGALRWAARRTRPRGPRRR